MGDWIHNDTWVCRVSYCHSLAPLAKNTLWQWSKLFFFSPSHFRPIHWKNCPFWSVGYPNAICYIFFSQRASPEPLWRLVQGGPLHFENRWSQPCHVTPLLSYGEIYKAARTHSCWLQPVQLAQQWQHGSLYLGRHFQLSNIALWGTQQIGFAFPLNCKNCLACYHGEQLDKNGLYTDE